MSPFVRAAVLSITSSLDNLVVGLALGVARQPLPASTTLIVAVANALGMWVSSLIAGVFGQSMPRTAAAAAALIFLGLGASELKAAWDGEASSPLSQLHDRPFLLAVPMTCARAEASPIVADAPAARARARE